MYRPKSTRFALKNYQVSTNFIINKNIDKQTLFVFLCKEYRLLRPALQAYYSPQSNPVLCCTTQLYSKYRLPYITDIQLSCYFVWVEELSFIWLPLKTSPSWLYRDDSMLNTNRNRRFLATKAKLTVNEVRVGCRVTVFHRTYTNFLQWTSTRP